jgi:group I intron endonuclease
MLSKNNSMKNECGVYKITSPSGKFYIGSSVDIRKRWNEHRCRLAGHAGGHHNQYLKNAAVKYGIDSLVFEVLELCARKDVREREQFYIDSLKPSYNLSTKVESLLTELWAKPAFRAANSQRCSEQNKKRHAEPGGLLKSRERVKFMQTPEAKKKSIATRAKSIRESPELKEKLRQISSNTLKILHENPEFREELVKRQTEAMTRKSKDPEFCRKRDSAASLANSKAVLCIETGAVFLSIKLANEFFGGQQQSNIGAIARGCLRPKTAYGHTWKFVEVKS